MSSSVEGIFRRELCNPLLEADGESALLAAGKRQLAFTTDCHVVRPLFFPGGDIGELAVNGAINRLAMFGARPVALSASLIIEDGRPVGDLERIAGSMASASLRAGVPVAAVDAEVVEPGKADGLYINTSGVGCVEHRLALRPTAIREGDLVIVSGAIGDHGAALLAARAGVETAVRSDTAPLHTLVAKLLRATDEVRCLRQPTRGGIAGVLSELALAAAVGIAIEQSDIPIRSEVSAACEILDVDPQGLVSEGNLLAVVSPDAASNALAALRSHPVGREAAIIGEVTADDPGGVNFDVAVCAQGSGQPSIRR